MPVAAARSSSDDSAIRYALRVSWMTLYSCSHIIGSVLFCSLAVLDPRVGHTMDVLSPSICFSIYLYPLSFWLTLPLRVLSTTWSCLSRPCDDLPRVRTPGIVPHNRAYVVYGEAYGRGVSASGRQRREGRSFSASAPPSVLPPADWHPSAVSLAIHNQVWL